MQRDAVRVGGGGKLVERQVVVREHVLIERERAVHVGHGGEALHLVVLDLVPQGHIAGCGVDVVARQAVAVLLGEVVAVQVRVVHDVAQLEAGASEQRLLLAVVAGDARGYIDGVVAVAVQAVMRDGAPFDRVLEGVARRAAALLGLDDAHVVAAGVVGDGLHLRAVLERGHRGLVQLLRILVALRAVRHVILELRGIVERVAVGLQVVGSRDAGFRGLVGCCLFRSRLRLASAQAQRGGRRNAAGERDGELARRPSSRCSPSSIDCHSSPFSRP